MNSLGQMNLFGNFEMTKLTLATISLLLMQVSLSLRLEPILKPPKKTNATKKTVKRVIHPVIRVNTTEMAEKNKDKAQDLSHIKCYTCK